LDSSCSFHCCSSNIYCLTWGTQVRPNGMLICYACYLPLNSFILTSDLWSFFQYDLGKQYPDYLMRKTSRISMFCRSLFVLCPFSFGHCVVCSSIYGFWLPLWYLQTLLTISSLNSLEKNYLLLKQTEMWTFLIIKWFNTIVFLRGYLK
jgi:hypothetical protein